MIDWFACLLVRALSALFASLPASWVIALGKEAGRLASHLQPKRVRIGWNNLRAAYHGKMDEREAKQLVRKCFSTLGAGIFELLRLPVIDRAYYDRYIAMYNQKVFDDAYAGDRPFIFLTGHYGNWELTAIASALIGRPMLVLARVQDRMPRLYNFLVSLRESKGCKVIHKGGAMRKLIEAVEAGDIVGIVGDQASRRGIFIPFMGRRALFATGPFQLAHSKNALIIPAFIRRDGPVHQTIYLENPIDLSGYDDSEEAIEAGLRTFAEHLTHHINEEPSHWLWMHKRWKHTPDKRVIILSDGKPGHVKQSRAVAEMLAEEDGVTVEEIELRYRSASWRSWVVAAAMMAPGSGIARWLLRRALEPGCVEKLFRAYADVAISCGSVANPINVIWSKPFRLRSITIMNPKPIPMRHLDIVIAPVHDGVRASKHAQLVTIRGALCRVKAEDLARAAEQLRRHPRFDSRAGGPFCALCLGGDTHDYALSVETVRQVVEALLAWCDRDSGSLLVTTSRRTSPEVESWLKSELSKDARCALLVIANEDKTPNTIEGMFGLAEKIVVTGESVSMVTEACSAGPPVWIMHPVKRKGRSSRKHERFLEDLKQAGLIRLFEAPLLTRVIQEPVCSSARLDNFQAVKKALEAVI